ncbi:MAG: nodulation protein NfeD [Gammaproteobacteria bacterium]|nr:MAG: nodulation protein NfeD [Gammaproteobacteria bacterium]
MDRSGPRLRATWCAASRPRATTAAAWWCSSSTPPAASTAPCATCDGAGDQPRGRDSGLDRRRARARATLRALADRQAAARAQGQLPDGQPSRDAAPPSAPGSTMERKVVNDAVAYIRGLAELRGRNADWAEQAVRGAASLSSTAALEQKVIDVIARDLPDLLARIDGREVRIDDRTVKLATRELTVVRVKPDWRTQLLAVITNPTVAYGLMLIGIWGLLLEGYNPGAVLPGVAGSICLLIALFAFQILSVNYAGLALVVLGTGMIISEFFFPTYGSLGIGGLIAFVVGSLILFDTDVPGMSVGRPLIGAIATVGGLMIAGIVYLATRSMRRPVATGTQSMIGETAEVVADFTGRGRVRYGGELWNARSDTALRSGDLARIVRVEGLTLWVEPTARAP